MPREETANPWLAVSASDYEAHMALPSVGQLPLLNALFAEDLRSFRPRSLVLVGCATGNGLEHVDATTTPRVLAIDIHPDYLGVLAARHAARIPGLQLLQADLMEAAVPPGSAELVHAALVLEYVPAADAVRRMAGWLAPGGVLSIVLQRPSTFADPITETEYASLRQLGSIMRLVEPEVVADAAASAGLTPGSSELIGLPRGKAFLALRYRRGS